MGGAFYLARGLVQTAQQRERAEQIAVEQRERDQRRRQIEAAFHYMERWNNPQFYHVRSAFREILRVGMAETEGTRRVMDRLAADDSLRSNVMDVMNFFEEVAVAIDLQIADEELLRRVFRGILSSLWMTLEPFVNQRRTMLRNPRVFVECEALHKRWA